MRPHFAGLVGFVAGVACSAALYSVLTSNESGSGHQANPASATGFSPASRPAIEDLPPGRLPTVDELGPRTPESLSLPAATFEPEAGSLGVLVYGSVRDESGSPIDVEYAEVEFTPDVGQPRSAPITAGAYSLTGLSPGSWTVATRMDHYRPASRTLGLAADQPFVRLDLVVQGSHSVVIRAVTPDGRPLVQALAEDMPDGESWGYDLAALASVEPLSEAPALRQHEWSRWGIGEFWLRGGFGATIKRVEMPDDCLGLLELDVVRPVWGYLVFGSCILDSRPIAADATEVTFTASVSQFAQCFGSITARFVDAIARAPVADVSVSVTTPDSWGGFEKSAADGRWQREKVAPGEYQVTAFKDDSEHLVYEISVGPDETVDLGDITLQASTAISGQVVDAEGLPVATMLRLTCLGRQGPWTVGVESTNVQTNSDGDFEFANLGPRVYALHVVDDDHARHPMLVSTVGGDVRNLRVQALAGVTVTLYPDWPAGEMHGVRVTNSDGLVVTQSETCHGQKPWVRRLMAGRYTVTVFDDAADLRSQPIEVADKDVKVDILP